MMTTEVAQQAMTPADLAQQACSFFLARLDAEVSRLRGVVFPGHDIGPQKWLKLIVGLLDTASGYLSSASEAGVSPVRKSKLIRDAETLGNNAYLLLRFAAGADATDIPHQVVGPFKFWADQLKIKNTIFFRAEHLPNYELATADLIESLNRIELPSKSLEEALRKIDWPVLRVTVPSHAMGMLPHFAVVAHELGHAIQGSIDLDPVVDAKWPACEARIESRLAGVGINYSSHQKVRVQGILSNWVNEIKADAVGHYLAGPAFFLALCGFLELSGQGYGIWMTHPPSDLRRDLLITQLKADEPSHISILTSKAGLSLSPETNSPHVQRCPDSESLFSILKNNIDLTDAAILVELVPFINSVGNDIFTSAKQTLTDLSADIIYTPNQLENDLQAHLDALCELIPPIEWNDGAMTRPASLATILNVGWVAMLTKLDQMPEPNNQFGDTYAWKMERLHELLLKALELSEARRLWEMYK